MPKMAAPSKDKKFQAKKRAQADDDENKLACKKTKLQVSVSLVCFCCCLWSLIDHCQLEIELKCLLMFCVFIFLSLEKALVVDVGCKVFTHL